MKVSKAQSVHITAQGLQDACIEMVTKNGRPLTIVEDSGFCKIINPILDSFEEKIIINRHNIKDLIKVRADQLRYQLKTKLKGKIISIKVDSAFRLDRSILGVNIQYMDSGQIIVNTLAMLELKEKHAAEYLLQRILDVLKKYNIDIKQIYSFTSDNGANFIKTGKLFKKMQICLSAPCMSNKEGSSNLHNYIDNDNTYPDSDSDVEIKEEMDTRNPYHNLENEISNLNIEFMVSIRCAAHTLQLAISDFLKETSLHGLITICTNVIKKLRNPSMLTMIKKVGLRKPVLHCPTRWDSTLKMIRSLINLRLFCIEYQAAIPSLKISDDNWEEMSTLDGILTPAHEACLNLQNEQLSMSDFFNVITKCKLAIKKINNSYSGIFERVLHTRLVNIMNNDTMLSCIYLDPRYQILLNNEQKNSAIQHICEMHDYIIRDYKQDDSFPDSSLPKEDYHPLEKEFDEIDELILTKEREFAKFIKIPVSKQNFRTAVENFDNIQRISRNEDPRKYWKNNTLHGELSEIANILFAVPVTQVSVERAFSTLKFILADNRDRLSEDMLEDILFIKLN